VETSEEIREFLTSRRARITPEQAGLRTYGSGPRRVPGLRREEVALLAGVSVDYYTRLERGNRERRFGKRLGGARACAAAGRAEWAHLFDLARAQSTTARPRRRRAPQRVRPGAAAARLEIGGGVELARELDRNAQPASACRRT
jgi:transcriptional regulator with XRE-family HTH domain